MPIIKLCLGWRWGAVQNQLPDAVRRSVSGNSLHVSSPKVSLHLGKETSGANQGTRCAAERGARRAREAASVFSRALSHEILSEQSLDFSAQQERPLSGPIPAYLSTMIPHQAPLCPRRTRAHHHTAVSQDPKAGGHVSLLDNWYQFWTGLQVLISQPTLHRQALPASGLWRTLVPANRDGESLL